MASGGDVRVVPTGACHDCGGRCVLKVHVKDGVAVKVETDDTEEPQLRACARGRAYRKQVYAQDRLLFPQVRVGERGEGRFSRVTWDEALDRVAMEITRVKETYGPEAILVHTYSGSAGVFHNGVPTLHELFKALGGYTSGWGGASAESSTFASRATYGTLTTGNTRDDLLNSRLILLWGVNPATSIYGTNTMYYLAKAKEAGAKVVVVDPRFTDTAAVVADRWVPIRPGTDAAVMAAMAYVMITQGLHDRAFVERHTVGFDKFSDYVLGHEDGVPKSPSWAEQISAVPSSIIVELARDYAIMRPGALIPGFAPGRTAFGEQFHRMASTLAAMTGNVGVHGGGAAGFERGPVGPMFPPTLAAEKDGATYQEQLRALDVSRRLRRRFHLCRIWDAILQGKAGGYPSDLKMAYIGFGNPLNQFPNVKKGVEALKSLDFIVVHEQFMTATARFADVLLPVTTHWERNDFARPWLSGPYFLYLNKVIEPLGEARSDRDICRELARRLGVSCPALEVSEDEGIMEMIRLMGDMLNEIPDLEVFKKAGLHKMDLKGPLVSFQMQVRDPENHPFPTPSGKIEIYCQRIADLGDPRIPPIPKYVEPWEGPADPMTQSYPLQLITTHHKTRAHSCFHNNPWLRELEPQTLWLNAQDAAARGITDGEEVRVYNDRGETIVKARVTERIMPGVVALGEGAWYAPDNMGRDRGGCANVLTKDDHSPGGGFPFNTALVEVERFLE